MIKKISKSSRTSPQHLSPWQDKHKELDDSYMGQYCQQTLPTIIQNDTKPLCEKKIGKENIINSQSKKIQFGKKRSISYAQNCSSNQQEREQFRKVFQRLATRTNKQNKQIKRQIKTSHDQQRRAVPVQQIAVKSYFLEGSKDVYCRQGAKKKEPSYVIKYKFAQNKRNMNLQMGLWSNAGRMGKQIEEKENITLLKLTRYEMN